MKDFVKKKKNPLYGKKLSLSRVSEKREKKWLPAVKKLVSPSRNVFLKIGFRFISIMVFTSRKKF